MLINIAMCDMAMSKQTMLLTVVMTAAAMVAVTAAYGDHIDNHVWIVTADGKFITHTDAVVDTYETTHRGVDDVCYLYPENDRTEWQQRGEYVDRLNDELGDDWYKVKERINGVGMIKPFTGCGETATERDMATKLDIKFQVLS